VGRHIGKLIGKNVACVAALFVYEQIKSLPTKSQTEGMYWPRGLCVEYHNNGRLRLLKPLQYRVDQTSDIYIKNNKYSESTARVEYLV
jgi:hypothetical protein